ncbi:MAG: orotidine-5'-phosphate decarboxylase, partial [Oscillospiraceae bacterium]|nr:orotidine-5'-phosphate decarboxylase [Oscillospiraceae bacterium]
MTNMDKLSARVAANGAVCLGLDTSVSYLPEGFAAKYNNPADAVYAFNKRIIDATRGAVACYKVQIAYYEALGLDGMAAFSRTLKYIRGETGVPVITDCKRGDIKESAAMYAEAHLREGGDFESDFVTLNPYMGMDTLEPYAPYLEAGKGCFVLLRTSNGGSRDIQGLPVAGGGFVYGAVAERLARFGEKYMG